MESPFEYKGVKAEPVVSDVPTDQRGIVKKLIGWRLSKDGKALPVPSNLRAVADVKAWIDANVPDN